MDFQIYQVYQKILHVTDAFNSNTLTTPWMQSVGLGMEWMQSVGLGME